MRDDLKRCAGCGTQSGVRGAGCDKILMRNERKRRNDSTNDFDDSDEQQANDAEPNGGIAWREKAEH